MGTSVKKRIQKIRVIDTEQFTKERKDKLHFVKNIPSMLS